MLGKNKLKYFESIKRTYDENYNYFLKNILLQTYKIKNLYELKNFKPLRNKSFSYTLSSPVKDIFNYQTKKVSTDYYMTNITNDSYKSSMMLDHNLYLNNDMSQGQSFEKTNTSNEDNQNVLFRMINPAVENLEIKIIKNLKNDKETFLQLWQTSVLINSVKLEDKGVKSIYIDDTFGRPKFSPDGKKLIFLVELDRSKNYKNYFSIPNAKNEFYKENDSIDDKNKETNGDFNTDKDDEFIKNMKKFEYRQEFGELLDDKADPVIAIYDILKNDVGLIDLSEINKTEKIKIYPATPIFDFDNADIIFTGYYFDKDIKLGITYCLKRPSKIFLLKNPTINWKNEEKPSKAAPSSDKIKVIESPRALYRPHEEGKCFSYDNKLFVISNVKIERGDIFDQSGININDHFYDESEEIIFKKTQYNYTNIFPILSPNGKNFIFFSTEKATPHMNGLRLNHIDWAQEKQKLEDYLKRNLLMETKYNTGRLELVKTPNFRIFAKVVIDKIKFENSYYCGIYSYEDMLSKSLFISNDKIIINTYHRNSNKFYIYDISKNILLLPYQNMSICVFDSKQLRKNSSINDLDYNKDNNIFFSVNSYANIFPFVCCWRINDEKYEELINKILQTSSVEKEASKADQATQKTSKQNKVFITQANYSEHMSNNNKENNNSNANMILDQLIALETENSKILNKELNVLCLSEASTNLIFDVRQIESENADYFSPSEKSDNQNQQFLNFDLPFKGFTHKADESNKAKENLEHKKANEEDLFLQSKFKAYVNEVVTNTILEEFSYNNVKGFFVYSGICGNKNTEQNKNEKNENLVLFPKKPIVYYIHGGPNGTLSKKFWNMQTIFLCHGYGVLTINYPGSTGFGQDYLNELNGKIGYLDVKACGEFLKAFINENKNKYNLEENNTIIYGGSHGGFLGCFLICEEQYKHMFSSAVLRNPVTDLCSNIACSDINDWIIGQAKDIDWEKNYPPSQEIYKSFYEQSPVYKTKNAVTPTLIRLGKCDKRVNYFNGIYFYNALQKNNCESKLYIYPEDSHAISGDESDIDGAFVDLIFIKNHLRN